jgi:acyl carrier protein
MIPTEFVKMEALPMTANGKLDRKALPEPDHERPELGIPYTRPQNETEDSVVRIWEEVLNVRSIGIHDNFFDLGGHSLAATRVVSRIFQQYRLEIPLRSLFQSPTIAEMAVVIAEHQGRRLGESQLSAILDELASLSDAEAQRFVSKINSTIATE